MESDKPRVVDEPPRQVRCDRCLHLLEVLEAALPDHLARARTVACELVPQLVGLAGVAHICRVEDSIPFSLRLVPERAPREPEPEQPVLVEA